MDGAFTVKQIHLALNGSELVDVSISSTADRDTWADWRINLFLTAGINQIALRRTRANEAMRSIFVRSR